MSDLTHLLSDSQRRLLQLLKRTDSLTVAEAVESLDLAETTVRQHLDRLHEAGLVDKSFTPEGRGRPTAHFALSSDGQQLFPTEDSRLLNELLGFLSREGYHRPIDDFFREFWDRRAEDLDERLQQASADSLEATLEVLESFLAEQGFMPEVHHDPEANTLEIRECNCPLKGAVEQTRLPCRLEAEFLEQAVHRALDRVEYIPDGNNACTYRFADASEQTTANTP